MTDGIGITVSDEELDAFLNELFQTYGYDFTGYARSSLKRRLNRLLIIDRYPSVAEFLYRVKSEPDYLTHVVEEISVNVTEMFRDPPMFKTLREQILPVLATHPLIRIWHAGCATGEEVYSMAILLEEAALLHKTLLYATDINPSVIENIKRGTFPLNAMKQHSESYIAAGGKKDFSAYYTAKYGWAKFDARLSQRMIASTHNLVSDRSFNAFHLIFCRNVLIYFNKELQENVLSLFDESLEKLGFLVLGSKENLRFSSLDGDYEQTGKEKIWRKMR